MCKSMVYRTVLPVNRYPYTYGPWSVTMQQVKEEAKSTIENCLEFDLETAIRTVINLIIYILVMF